MSDNNPLMNLGDLAKPVETLINRISDAIGGIAKPWQLKRVAKAEAKAAIIRSAASEELPEETKRAIQRILIEETFKQRNIEEIIAKASPEVQESAKPEDIEEDWITHFFDKCRLVSDEDMQMIWAKVLAGEANSPGTFSKRTISFVETLEKSDANLFQNLCRFIWHSGNSTYPIIFNINNEIYNTYHITYGNLLHLDSIGLVKFNNLSGYVLKDQPDRITFSYFNNRLIFEFINKEKKDLSVGSVVFTTVGNQLAKICDVQPIDSFYDYIISTWFSESNLIMTSPLIHK